MSTTPTVTEPKEKNGPLFSTTGAQAYLEEHTAKMEAEMHAITVRNPMLSDAQRQGHIDKFTSKYTLARLVLREKEMFRTPGVVELINRRSESQADLSPVWRQFITMQMVLPFAGRIEYPTLMTNQHWAMLSPQGIVRGHTLVHDLQEPIERCTHSAVGAMIDAWLRSVKECTAALNTEIDAFNATLAETALGILNKQCYAIVNAMREMERLPYPIKTQ